MQKLYEYKGYLGSAEIDTENNVLVGRLMFIRDTIAYSATTPTGLEKEFKAAVDDYLATCAQFGDVPDKPCKGVFNVRMTAELHRSCAIAAQLEGNTLNEFVVNACEERLKKRNVSTLPQTTTVVLMKTETRWGEEFATQPEKEIAAWQCH